MHILIDDQKVVEVSPEVHLDEDRESRLVLNVNDTHTVLDAWKNLDVGRRAFDWGGDADSTGPDVIFVAMSGDTLWFERAEPFWDGQMVHSGHALDVLEGALPLGTLRWGDDIGEDGVN